MMFTVFHFIHSSCKKYAKLLTKVFIYEVNILFHNLDHNNLYLSSLTTDSCDCPMFSLLIKCVYNKILPEGILYKHNVVYLSFFLGEGCVINIRTPWDEHSCRC